jgi:uncharacterized protein YjbI with pentapeptide repeats
MSKNFAGQTLRGRPFKEGDDLVGADFQRATLRGVNFKSLDLSRANFSGADIRGANFSDAVLIEANFTGAKAGLQKRWMALQLGVVFFLSTLMTFTAVFYNEIMAPSLFSQVASPMPGILILMFLGATCLTIVLEGFTVKAVSIIAGAGAIAGAGVGADVNAGTGVGSVIGAGVGAVAIAGAVGVISPFAGAIAGTGALTGATVGIFMGENITGVRTVVVVGAAVVIFLSCYVYWRVLKEDEKFTILRAIGLAFGSWGGTSFCGADLRSAVFVRATLKGTSFNASKSQHTRLNLVDWTKAENLNCARVGGSILTDRAVRELLVTRRGCNKNYSNANLSGANLTGIDLTQANLTRTDLSKALLDGTKLKEAILREANVLGAKFKGVHLTGACIEAWNIDYKTILVNIDCQFVFQLQEPNENGSRERRPHDSDKIFQPGDFEKLHSKMMKTVQIFLRNGMNIEACAAAFQKVMEENPGITPNSFQSIEKKDRDMLLTIEVPSESNKGKIEQQFDEVYQTQLNAKKNANLEALLDSEQRHNRDLKELALKQIENLNFSQLLSNLTIIAGDRNIMSDNKNQGITGGDGTFINTGTQNLSNSLVNLSGTVTNSLNQLQSANHPKATELADLLKQLQTAINNEPNLLPEDKAEALTEVNVLAEAGKNPQKETQQKKANIALEILKNMITALTPTATLAKACSELLPAITKLLGL